MLLLLEYSKKALTLNGVHCNIDAMIISSTGVPSPPVIKNKKKETSLPDFNLFWSPPDGCALTMYTVYYKEIGSPDKEKCWHRINTTAVTNTLSALLLDCDTEYEFAVSAWNQFGESNLSQSWRGKFVAGTFISFFFRKGSYAIRLFFQHHIVVDCVVFLQLLLKFMVTATLSATV